MKAQIEKLITLAKRYEGFGKQINVSENWHSLRGSFGEEIKGITKSDGDKIAIYFTNNKNVCSIQFGKIELQLFRNVIEMPFDTTTESLQILHDDCQNYLETFLIPNQEKMIMDEEEIRLAKINELEGEIERLKSGETFE
jgi:hypothetical protein